METTDQKTVKPPGRPVTDSGQFRKDLISFIERQTSLKQNGKPGFRVESQFVDSKVNGGEHCTIIHCGGGIDMVHTIMVAIESCEEYLSRVKFFDGSVIRLSNKISTHGIHLENLEIKEFAERLKKEILQYPNVFNAQILTSYTVAAKSDPIVMKILFATDHQAERFITAIAGIVKTQKDGKVVKISTRLFEIKRIIREYKNFLSVKNENHSNSNPKGLVISPIEVGSDHQPVGYIHMSRNYDEFHYFPFNRGRNKKHVMELVTSMNKHGVLSFVTVVETSCIDGVFKKWVADGQHRLEAFKYRGDPVLYTITTANSKKEIVRLIADLNKSSRRWVTKDFLNAWESLEIEDYKILKETLENTRLPITLLFEVFTGMERKAATSAFQKGEFEIKDKMKALRYIGYLLDFKRYIPRNREIYSAFLTFFERLGSSYSHEQMTKVLLASSGNNIFVPGDTKEGILNKIKNVYHAS